jgi:hypothetical protein
MFDRHAIRRLRRAHLVLAPADVARKSAPSASLSATRAAVWLRAHFTSDRVSLESEVASNETRIASRRLACDHIKQRRGCVRPRRNAVSPHRDAENCVAGAAIRGGALSTLALGRAMSSND